MPLADRPEDELDIIEDECDSGDDDFEAQVAAAERV